jgi:hypothetical protein
MAWVLFLSTAALVLEPITIYKEIDSLFFEGFSMSN